MFQTTNQIVNCHQIYCSSVASLSLRFDVVIRATSLVGGVHNGIAREAFHRSHADAKTSQWQ